jgi:hypothetical protein
MFAVPHAECFSTLNITEQKQLSTAALLSECLKGGGALCFPIPFISITIYLQSSINMGIEDQWGRSEIAPSQSQTLRVYHQPHLASYNSTASKNFLDIYPLLKMATVTFAVSKSCASFIQYCGSYR